MRSSKETLGLDHLYVMCHGEGEPWALAEGVTAVPAACLASEQWLPAPIRRDESAPYDDGVGRDRRARLQRAE